MSAPEPLANPVAEHRLLAGALERSLRRRQAMGLRRVAPSEPLVELPSVAQPTSAAQAAAPAAPETLAVAPATPATAAPSMPAAPTAALTAEQVQARAAAVASLAAQAENLEDLQAAVSQCTACGLCDSRTQTVFADGSGKRGVFFLGDAPGEQEDQSGVPFVGPAGQLLSDIIEKGMKIPRAEVSISNILKCRTPGERQALPEEMAICVGWLERQIELTSPTVLVPLGPQATQFLLQTEQSMERLRGQVHQRQGRQVVPTWHPTHLLRSPEKKSECWQDIKLAMGLLGL